jgi:hypothetical protein
MKIWIDAQLYSEMGEPAAFSLLTTTDSIKLTRQHYRNSCINKPRCITSHYGIHVMHYCTGVLYCILKIFKIQRNRLF